MQLELDANEIPPHLQMYFEPVPGLKSKDLSMIPARVAIALQDDGWWLRSEIVWHKRAPMPESVTDRPTRAHEMVYMLSKSPRYFYDADAIREPHSRDWEGDIGPNNMHANASDHLTGLDRGGTSQNGLIKSAPNPGGRNRRSVWTLGPESFRGSHFAVMPTKLVEPCIQAGTSAKGCCPICSAPWARVVERETVREIARRKGRDPSVPPKYAARGVYANDAAGCYVAGNQQKTPNITTTGWRPTCAHDAEPVPCVVLDPFAGSGTVAAVAASLGRHYIGFELNEDYVALANRRLSAVTLPLLAEAL